MVQTGSEESDVREEGGGAPRRGRGGGASGIPTFIKVWTGLQKYARLAARFQSGSGKSDKIRTEQTNLGELRATRFT